MIHRSITLGLALMVVLAGVGSAQNVYWVPIVAHAEGVGGSAWRSDVSVLSSCAEADVELRLHASTGVLSTDLVVESGSQTMVRDVVALLTTDDATGALEVRSSQLISVTSRTYNDADPGTFGQALPGLQGPAGLGLAEVAYLQHLEESASFRTNIGVLNMGVAPASVSVTLFDGAGVEIGAYVIDVPPGTTVQDNRPYLLRFGRGDLTGGYAELTVTTGWGVYAYGSVIDAETGDPTTIDMELAPLCGSATPITGVWAGAEVGAEDGWIFTFSEGIGTAAAPGGVKIYTGTARVDTSVVPNQIDVLVIAAAQPELIGLTTLGIFELAGDDLTVAFNTPGVDVRPDTLEPGDLTRVWVLSRQ